MLEQRLTKQQILTLYANETYLGSRASFSIQGFGEGAAAYFGKDLRALTLPEAATLVGDHSRAKRQSFLRSSIRKMSRSVAIRSLRQCGRWVRLRIRNMDAAKATDLKLVPVKG